MAPMKSVPLVLFCAANLFPVIHGAGSKKGGSKACSHQGFYSKKIVPLCEQHFPDAASKNLWVVQFYHPYIKNVVDQREVLEALAATPANIENAKVGAVDCMNNGEFCAKHGIRQAPTTRVISAGAVRDFEGDHVLDKLQAFVKESAKRFKEMEEGLKCNKKGLFIDPKKDVVLPLCPERFPPSLEPLPWIVSFYETGDKNKDKTMKNTLNKIGTKYGNVPPKKTDAKNKKPLKLRVGAIHCNHDDSTPCEKLGITKFPTIRFYRSGAEPVDFDSFVDSDELKQWADTQLKQIPQAEATGEMLKADMPQESKKEL